MVLDSNYTIDDTMNLPDIDCSITFNTPMFGSFKRVLRVWSWKDKTFQVLKMLETLPKITTKQVLKIFYWINFKYTPVILEKAFNLKSVFEKKNVFGNDFKKRF